ncbi:uncharacterized protein LOC122849527 [Aphidius gifuensis]|uniref:uncharacterized protein LOC122849527 n=1 Tax=Aphidius gifuensis TaxID=684658 RepID=UPI001CDD3BC6|nr:uncharacterized protein LOC122849527 [Aphidius gifuensis]
MPKAYLALVKWVGGKYKDSFTPGVPVSWIENFDRKKFDNYNKDNDEIIYTVEWKEKKIFKKYKVNVIMISDKMSELENKIKILDGDVSPKALKPNTLAQYYLKKQKLFDDDENEKENDISQVDLKNSEKPADRKGKKLILQKHNNISNGPHRKRKYTETILDSDEEVKSLKEASDEDNDLKEASDEDNDLNDNKSPEPTNPTLLDILNAIKERDQKIEKLTKDIETLKSGGQRSSAARRPSYLSSESEKKNGTITNAIDLEEGNFVEGLIEIGQPGSDVTVTDLQWTTAISRGSYKFMSTSLVMSLFPMNVLLKSNYKGGKCKIKKDETPQKLTALDTRIVDAIKYSVQRKFKNTFTLVGFGQAINSKLHKLRSTQNQSKEPSDQDDI